MTKMYRYLVKFILPLLSAEFSHSLGMKITRIIGWLHRIGLLKRGGWADHPRLVRETPFGPVPSPFGLAAGFDKNAEALWGWQALGFGFIEVGTVTPLPQDGNNKPRLFRFVRHAAIVNRMGFNNDGAKAIEARLRLAKRQGLRIKVGVNIGKNKDTPIEGAAHDYRLAAGVFRDVADYLTINVSSPNTPGLRDLQSEKSLDEIVSAVRGEAPQLPLFIKVAPDHFDKYIEGISTVLRKHRVEGIICGNTLANHASASGLNEREILELPQGGLSGRPIFTKNLELCESYALKGFFTVGVGGIFSHTDAIRYFQAGARLVQVYTGLVYQGPLFVKKSLQGLIRASLEREKGQNR